MKQDGFTLVEVIITITLMAILLGVAVPGFQELMRNNQLVTQTNHLVTSINLARSEAVKRSTSVQVSAGSFDAATCTFTAGNWNGGWVVWVEGSSPLDDPPSLNACTEVLKVVDEVRGSSTLASKNGDKELAYSASGIADAAICFDVGVTGHNHTRMITVSATGMVAVTKDAACP